LYYSKPGSLLIIPPQFATVTVVHGGDECHGLRWSVMGTPSLWNQTIRELNLFIKAFPEFENTSHAKLLAFLQTAKADVEDTDNGE
jgi:hypothetical protein